MRTFIIGLLLLCTTVTCWAGDLAPIVTSDWLEKNLSEVTIIDIRKADEYREGHLPGAVNVMYGALAIKKNNLDNEMPQSDDFADVLNAAGLTAKSRVVIYNKVDNILERANMTRIAQTFVYAGIKDVAILDGGWNKWTADKKAVSKDAVAVKPANEKFAFNNKIIVEQKQVLERHGKALLVDTREPEFFFGAAKLPFVEKPGRIKGAVSLPSTWAFSKEGAFRPTDELQKYVTGVIGNDKKREIIVYCDTGRLASVWWYMLTQVFGYTNVAMYDGSSQDFMKNPSFPIEQYSW
ncbi:MAG: sulfurtransferase [Verrucomicrobia bacterium]|nr:sulfurtransferase [Deltaproteobacteria bacterium]